MATAVSKPQLDLGELDGKLLVFGGPYSNLQATQAMQRWAMEQNIAASNVICTGDVVAYAADAEATSNLIREWGVTVLAGNCEISIANSEPDCGCGFSDGSACDLLSLGWYRHASNTVSAANRQWMAGLADVITFQYAQRRFRVVHGGVEQVNQFVFASQAADMLPAQFTAAACDVVLAGHCGIPFMSSLAVPMAVEDNISRNESSHNKASHNEPAHKEGHAQEHDNQQRQNQTICHWLNAGAIGLPANDGTPRVWFMTIEATEADEANEADDKLETRVGQPGAQHQQPLLVTLHSLDYDHAGAAQRMRDVGLTQGYHETIDSGLWPSLDVLPAIEKTHTGKPLQQQQKII